MSHSITKICEDFVAELDIAIGEQSSESIFILTDDNTRELCLPQIGRAHV